MDAYGMESPTNLHYIIAPPMLKRCDIFRKIQSDLHDGSATGGVFTIVAMVIGAFLLFQAFRDYTAEKYETDLIIENDDNPILPMRITMLFNSAPCHIIGLRFHDEAEYDQSGLEDKLNRTRLLPSGEQIPYARLQNRENEIKQMKDAINSGEQCRVEGLLMLPKTPGYIKFDLHAHGEMIKSAPELYSKVSTKYILQLLEFGDKVQIKIPIVHQSETIKKYIEDLETKKEVRQFIQDFSSHPSNQDYLNHIKVIPVKYQNSTDLTTTNTYRYSLRSGRASKQEMFTVTQFFLQIQPINIVYRKIEHSFYQFAVTVFAIIGGVLGTIGIANSLSQGVLDTFKRK